VVHSQVSTSPLSKLSRKDSLNVGKVFKELVKAIETKQTHKIIEACLNEVECKSCINNDTVLIEPRSFVKAKKYAELAIVDFTKSKTYSALKSRGYTVHTTMLEKIEPHSFPVDYAKDIILYEVYILTYLPDELAKGHEGAVNVFQFVKINGDFKLYGIDSIP
jgi:hypothetical protein